MASDAREAAGFFIYRLNQDRVAEFLLLRNAEHGAWGVPKGHRDAGDLDALACAQRELKEETGLSDVLLHSGFRTEITYAAKRHDKGEAYQKTVTYFIGRLENGEVETSDEHDAIEWLPSSKARVLLKFANLVAVLDNACEYLEKQCKVKRNKDLE